MSYTKAQLRASKKYSKTHRDVCRNITNNWRNKVSENQKIYGYSEASLKTFLKEKLIKIIKILEKENEELKKKCFGLA